MIDGAKVEKEILLWYVSWLGMGVELRSSARPADTRKRNLQVDTLQFGGVCWRGT